MKLSAATATDSQCVSREAIAAAAYLELLKKCLTRSIFDDSLVEYRPALSARHPFLVLYRLLKWILSSRQLLIARSEGANKEQRLRGASWPLAGETMIGIKRLDNIQALATDVIMRNVDGDFIETGVWRGGAVILMRAVLKAYDVADRTVWVADSFSGLPEPDIDAYPEDAGSYFHQVDFLKVSLDEVKKNFAKYDLLDDQVKFLVGWFKDTLPSAPIKKLALMRLDGDMYESTMDSLNCLYQRLSAGGYCIIDDFNAIAACKKAVMEFRASNGINDEIKVIDQDAIFWQKHA
jgi:O-methyltransferase